MGALEYGIKMNKIDEFLQNYEAKATQASYRTQLNNYFKAIKVKNPSNYFTQDRDYKADLEEYNRNQKGLPPLSRKVALSVVKSYFDWNEIAIPNKTWKSLKGKIKGSMAWTMDKAPTNHILKQILLHGTVREKAVFLIGSSSGMRIDEVMQLLPDEINMDSDPVMITIPGNRTKNGNPRYCFISNEAKEYLEEWYKERDEYLRVAVEKGKNKTHRNGRPIFVKTMDDPRIFPFTYSTARLCWIRLLKKSGYDQRDKTTGVYIYHIHTLRKYFMSRMKLEIPETIVEALAGHSKYLSDAYRRYTPEEMGGLYKKGEHTIAVFETTSDERINHLDEQLKEKDMEIVELRKEMEIMRNQMNILMAGKLIEMDKKKG